MKNKKNLYLIISFIGIVLIIIGLFLVINNNESKNDSKNEKISHEVKEDKRKEIDLDTIDSTLLFNIPVIGNNKIEESKFVYQDKKITIDSFNSSELYAYVISMIDYDNVEMCDTSEDCEIKISKDLVQNKAKELFGNVNETFPEETVKNIGQICTLSDEKYICKNIEKANEYNSDYSIYFQATRNYLNINQLTKAERDGKYLYLYDQYINVRLDSNDSFDENDLNTYNYYVYKTSNTDEKIDDEVLTGIDYYENPVETAFSEKIIDKYMDLSTTYVHTFEINNDNTYRWISTEPVK